MRRVSLCGLKLKEDLKTPMSRPELGWPPLSWPSPCSDSQGDLLLQELQDLTVHLIRSKETSLELKQSSGQGLTHPLVPPGTLLDPLCSPCTLVSAWGLPQHI